MSEETTIKDVAVGMLQGVSTNAGSVAGMTSDPLVSTGIRVAGGIAGVVATLIKVFGVESVQEELFALASRQKSARISDEDLAADDEEIAAAIRAMYAESSAATP